MPSSKSSILILFGIYIMLSILYSVSVTNTSQKKYSILREGRRTSTRKIHNVFVNDVAGKNYTKYVPASTEEYIVKNPEKLGYNVTRTNPNGCTIWRDPIITTPAVHSNLVAYAKDLKKHTNTIAKFKTIPDLLQTIQDTNSHEICASARPHPDGIKGLFPSNQLSLSKSGYVEPLTPPMRHHKVCNNRKSKISLNYLVHDFEEMCLKLKPTSRRILIDMGASLSFHGKNQPIVKLLKLYEKFGFHFDHIYGFEVTFTDPKKVYEELLPEKYLVNYHWINVGVTSEKKHKLNPLHSILEKFNEDDFIIVKLDIDATSIEVPLAKQLLNDEDDIYHKLVDHFYFEHHVHLDELSGAWGSSMKGSIKESFDLFYGLREKGIPAHFWP